MRDFKTTLPKEGKVLRKSEGWMCIGIGVSIGAEGLEKNDE